MKNILLTQFSHDFRWGRPKLLDCSDQLPPCLIRQVDADHYRLSQYWDGFWRETDCFFDSTKERLNFLYSKNRGIELMYEEVGDGHRSLIRREYLDHQMALQKTDFAPCLLFYDYIKADCYLCLEKQNGPIVCRTEDGTHLWQTEEKFNCNGDHEVSVSEDWICILDFDRHILLVYSVNGQKLRTFELSKAFQDAQYSPRLYTDNTSYYIEGFWDDITKYVKMDLGSGKKRETLFTVPHDIYVTNCCIFNRKFLYTGEAYHGQQYGDVGILISQESGKYITKEVFFHPGVHHDVGGGEIKWIDDRRFYYWKPSRRTTLFCYDIDGKRISQSGKLGRFIESDLVIFQNQTYILSHKDHKNSAGWPNSREYFFSVIR